MYTRLFSVLQSVCASFQSCAFNTGMPHSFWSEVLLSFVDVWNRLPSNPTCGHLTSFGIDIDHQATQVTVSLHLESRSAHEEDNSGTFRPLPRTR